MRALAPVALATLMTSPGCQTDRRLHVAVATAQPTATVSDRFLSVAVDTAQLVGGTFWNPGVTSGETTMTVPAFDFTRPRLRALLQPLAHAYLRIGGTDADRTYYALEESPPTAPPAGYQWMLTRAQWDAASTFARALDFQILFTLNAGPGPRVNGGPWQGDNARTLLEYVAQHQDPVTVWELGNEINAYFLLHGFSLSAEDYARDVRAARALIAAITPGVGLAAPSSAYWPLVGEVGGLLPAFLNVGGDAVDIVTWHYYPQQSRRCRALVREATPTQLLDPDNLDEIDRWAAEVETARAAGAPSAPVWLGETSNAQCGGAPGVSDAFASSLWWLDELGKMARRGTPVVVRQSISGADYGLLAEPSLDPRPDYFASVLWRRLMGTRVLAVTSPSWTVRAYAHCSTPEVPGYRPGAVTVVAINLDASSPVSLALDGVGASGLIYRLSAEALTAPTVSLNGQPLTIDEEGRLPSLEPAPSGDTVEVAPASYAFIVMAAADAPACR